MKPDLKAISSLRSPRLLYYVSIFENISTPEPVLVSSSVDVIKLSSTSLLPSTPFTYEAGAINKERTKSQSILLRQKTFVHQLKLYPDLTKDGESQEGASFASDTPEKDLIAANRVAT